MFSNNGWKGTFPTWVKTTAHVPWDLKQIKHLHCAVDQGGSAAMSEYKCSRIAQIGSYGPERQLSAENAPFQHTHRLSFMNFDTI